MEPFPCQPGTFSNLTAVAECVSCLPGFYCEKEGQSSVTGICSAGYYCPAGTTFPVSCPTGHYCPQGSMEPFPCQSGTFSNLTGVAECVACHPGFYCEGKGQTSVTGICSAGYYCPAGTTTPVTCPMGYYCPSGTSSPVPCPKGTFGNKEGLRKANDCLVCPPGKQCNVVGSKN